MKRQYLRLAHLVQLLSLGWDYFVRFDLPTGTIEGYNYTYSAAWIKIRLIEVAIKKDACYGETKIGMQI